jgi:hypothetical protein
MMTPLFDDLIIKPRSAEELLEAALKLRRKKLRELNCDDPGLTE